MAAFSENALTVLHERYLRRDESGNSIEDATAMLRRVASAVADPARDFGEDRGEDGAVVRKFRHHARMERARTVPRDREQMTG